MISILILTKNEQLDLPGCLQSVAWSDDVHVLDSESTDQTRNIAEQYGAKFVTRPFDGYSSQRNFGLKNISFRYPWLFILDADERIPESLLPVLSAFIKSANDKTAAARIRRRDYWWGRWLKHAQISPFYIRLVRPALVHYEREINEVLLVDGETKDLPGHFDHYPFSKGLNHWIDKHNLYSKMEAQLIISGQIAQPSWKTAIFHSDFNERRLHQKAIFYKLPGRPLIKFLYMMVMRRAFFDGWPGIRYALLQSIYEYFIVLKTKEMMAQQETERRN